MQGRDVFPRRRVAFKIKFSKIPFGETISLS